jgi:8-oxo-dGTP diphosphatase
MAKQRYQVIPRTLVFVFFDDDVLLIQKKHWNNRYNVLGGHIEPGESVLRSALRELFEESGIVPDEIHLAGNIIIDGDSKLGILLFIFKCKVTNKEFILSDEGNLIWIKLEKIGEINVLDDVPDLVQEVSSWKPGDNQIIKHYINNLE